MATKVDIGKEVGRGWDLFKGNFGLLVQVNLLAMLVSSVSCGLLGGAMAAGNFLIVQRLLKNDPVKPQVGDLFKGFDYFLGTLLFGLPPFVFYIMERVAGLVMPPIVAIGFSLILGLVVFVIGPILQIGILYVALGKLSFTDACSKLFAEMSTGTFWMLFLTALIASFLSCLGVFACVIGMFFTLPVFACIIVCAYHSAYEGAEAPPALLE